jgi:N-acetylneuraminic acid mutarotase
MFQGAHTVGRAGHGAVIDDEARIIIFGGYAETGYKNDLFIINILEERFESPLTTGTQPTPRENFSMTLIQKRIYLFGGFQEGGVLNDLNSIDLLSFTWTKVETQGPAPTARQGMASVRVGKKIYISSGCDFRAQKCFTDTFVLDVDSLWWTKIDNK